MTNIYDSETVGSLAIEEFKNLVKYKDFIYQLIRRDIIARYKRSILGVAWTMLNPLGTMIILSIVFSEIFEVRGTYPAYILSNLVAWNFFSQTTVASMNAMLWGANLFRKIYLPRTSFIVSTIGTGVVNLVLSLIPLFAILFLTKNNFHLSLLFLPVAVLFLVMFSLGMSLLVSTYVPYFPDIAEMYPIVITAWMYLTPIIYPEEILENTLDGLTLKLNPLYHVIKIFRVSVFDGRFPTIQELLVAFAISIITLSLGWLIYTKKSETFTYHV